VNLMIATLNFGLLFFTGMIIYSLIAKRALAAGKWYYRELDTYKYWETVIGYIVFFMVIFFCRQFVVARLVS